MPRRIIIAGLAVCLGLLTPPAVRAAQPASATRAEQPPPAACMAPIPAGSADPVVRDVHFHVTTGSPLVSVTMCIASAHSEELRAAGANVGVFTKDGVLINYASQSYANVGPLTDPSATGPNLVLLYGVAIEVDPKYGQNFASNTVVALTTVSCTKPMPTCAPTAPRTQTFLLPVQIDRDLPGGRRPAK